METKFLKPAAGLTLPLPDGRPWPEDGALVEVDQYVRRRVADGDLVAAAAPSIAPAPADADTARKGK